MSNLTDFFPSGGGGLTPKFEEFNSSGTFTPTQALIDAGGYIEVFLVGAGGVGSSNGQGANGGEVIQKTMYLNSVLGITVTIGATTSAAGNPSIFLGSTAGGEDLTASGGIATSDQSNISSASWGSYGQYTPAGNGVFGYGAGGANVTNSYLGGVFAGKPNSGQGAPRNSTAGSGYCLIKWYE